MKKNTGPKREREQRQKDLEEISRLYLERKTLSEIAVKFNVSVMQISLDLKEIREKWYTATLDNFSKRQSEELARIDEVERKAIESYNLSVGVIEIKTSKESDDGWQETTKLEPRAGDPRFLDIILRCIENRCKILGLNSPEIHQVIGEIKHTDARESLQTRLIDIRSRDISTVTVNN